MSVVLYFAVFAFMSLPLYKSDFLLGTYEYAMSDYMTYLGMFMLIVIVYISEKFVILITGKLYALKYNK